MVNESNKRRSIIKKLSAAQQIIEHAKVIGLTDLELIEAIDLIKGLHEKEGTVPTAPTNNTEDQEETP